MTERRQDKLPCNHKLAYYENGFIKCCMCDWKKEIKGRLPRKDDLPYRDYVNIKKEMNG